MAESAGQAGSAGSAGSAGYTVVCNHEEQYSIWWTDRDIPEGWRSVGHSGTREECLAHIEEVWTDMRPLSLRRQMDGERS
ncbi:MbtH family protein [Streptosporangium sp. DT93]|uniref:MbtH family protein n=1 Tax=Streptosporangium sp. DT93 TaxID=3393428 RepID=UPI003CEBAB44